jgi:hypothetical protein
VPTYAFVEHLHHDDASTCDAPTVRHAVFRNGDCVDHHRRSYRYGCSKAPPKLTCFDIFRDDGHIEGSVAVVPAVADVCYIHGSRGAYRYTMNDTDVVLRSDCDADCVRCNRASVLRAYVTPPYPCGAIVRVEYFAQEECGGPDEVDYYPSGRCRSAVGRSAFSTLVQCR